MNNICHSINNACIPDQENQSSVYIGRQPIFDRNMNIFAYELLYRDSNENRANVTCQNTSTTTVILNLITEFGFTATTGNKIAFINLSRDYLTGVLPVQLPAKQVVLEILEDTVVDDALIIGLKNLINQGFTLALDDFIYSSEWDPILPLVDYIKVEIPLLTRKEIISHVNQLKKYNVKLLAEKIETEEEYEFLRECGFDLFQGYFLARPKVIEGKTISANELTILSLLSDLYNNDIKVDDLVKSISNDVSLCYKILRYINSAHYALARKVDSIREAITYVGLRKLKHWATLIAMSNISSKPDDLMQLTMTRAYMCEQIAEQLGEEDSQHCFSVGLLSTLDVLLGMPMKQVLAALPLSSDIQNSLMYFEGKAGLILACSVAYEKGDWDSIRKLGLGITPEQLRNSFFIAMSETNQNILKTCDN